ncbi:PD-(D/E)XK nuclease family protein [Thiomicrorhabdus sp. 6S2-11]|uniref:PD-(D/E)XK nuclease family protein n=1 Tax=Thiomicrorhabdus marina TaxID=2818442 RepID=A0ABS3Q4D6_9GAMM|nr:PD-(D/E)XK nuclease family protein [Thiomicrorhabdus marina]MBO1927200.1 PD-(D/E)XK nuclease family protein [Thiomicrorhabdus marina]
MTPIQSNQNTLHLCANNRLAAALKQKALRAWQSNTFQNDDNPYQLVAPSLQAMTFNNWWQQWRDSIAFAGLDDLNYRRLLSDFEAEWCFEQALHAELKAREENPDEIQLLNPQQTAKQLYQAWNLSIEYLQEEWLDDSFLSPEVQLFKAVSDRYQQRLQQNQWLDSEQLMKASLAQMQNLVSEQPQAIQGLLPNIISLHGFDDFSPNMQRWLNIMQQAGVQIEQEQIAENNTAQNSQLYAAQDMQDEVQQAVLWAWQQIQNCKDSAQALKIGVIAPEMQQYKQLLQTTLDDFLTALGAQQPDLLGNANKLYNLSLGQPLHQVPLVENALLCLQLFLQPQKTCRFSDWSRWLISPYTQGDLIKRHQADMQLRRLGWSQISLPSLLNQCVDYLEDEERLLPLILPTGLLQALEKLVTFNLAAKLSQAQFIEACETTLQQIGWPGSRTLSSSEYQQQQALLNAINQFASFQGLAQEQNVSQWLSLLQRYISEQLHQPQTLGEPPIQVMGMLEAGGQEFDALWVLGLSDQAWPRAANPNPFIPMHLQREHKLPRADGQRELLYAQQIDRRLQACTQNLCLSYPRFSGEAELLPSPLLEEFNAGGFTARKYQSMAQQLFTQAVPDNTENQVADNQLLEWHADAQGPELEIGSKAPGGSGILGAQSKCPLMAFFDYRLGAKYGLQIIDETLQSTNQGQLLHRVLELLWQKLGNQSALLLLTAEELDELLEQKIEEAFAEVANTLNDSLLKLEKARIKTLCLQWLELEKTRPNFANVGTESKVEIELAGIKFSVVVDRIDSVDGQALILDYKTGKASIGDLLKTPLQAPQLAVYLHALEQLKEQSDGAKIKNLADEICGIGYGLLHSDDGVSFSALAEDEGVLPKARSVQIFNQMAEKENSAFYQVHWGDLLNSLKAEVLDLAAQIQQGQAQMQFARETDVQYAEAKLALRLPEVRQQIAQALSNASAESAGGQADV